MDDNDLADVNFMDLDLNQEPTDQPQQRVAMHESLLSELESTHGRIEERIRQLEAVTARARQRQRWRQARNSMEIYNVPGELIVNSDENGNNSSGVIMERIAERGKGCKRDSSHLVAKALEMDSEVKKADKEGGSFYDCNICLDVAREPVLTCCGHLFCWPCFYQVSDIDSTSKECPVCKGEVSESTVIPIYGNGDSEPVHETESGLKIPPRPKACRIESVRQQRVTQGLSHVPVAEALRRIRISIGAMGNQAPQQEGSSSVQNFDTTQEGQNSDVPGGHRFRIHQVSRVLSESAASLSSLSSALSNAERLVEDLETVINNRLIGNASRAVPVDISPSIVIQPNNTSAAESTADTNASLPINSTSLAPDTMVRTRNSRTLPPFVRRRSIASRISDLDSQDARESRRRRLN